MQVEVKADATAAICMASRRGTGKVRHLDVSYLWIQERIRCGDVKVSKVASRENPADLMTKYVDRATIARHMTFCNLFPEEGRAASAPELTNKDEVKEQNENAGKEEQVKGKPGRNGEAARAAGGGGAAKKEREAWREREAKTEKAKGASCD